MKRNTKMMIVATQHLKVIIRVVCDKWNKRGLVLQVK